MKAREIREKYLKFFKEKGHVEIAASPLVLKDDRTTLFTSSGMQQLVPFLMGKKHPLGNRLVNSQPSIRTQDIEEVGDNRHTTFFEMLGNWSLGDYFKENQIPWFWEFLTKELNLPTEKLYVSVFEGADEVPKDSETFEIWKKLGVKDSHIFFYGVTKNWWSRSGIPSEMPEGEIGGPDSEVFFEFTQTEHDPKFGKECHPNCDCGRFMEIGNSVFMEYKKQNGKLVALPQKNVDFGGGLERLTAAANDNPDIFEIDLFNQIIKGLENKYDICYVCNLEKGRNMRIVADHLRASVMLISSEVLPSNKAQGYILRRLLRRATLHAYLLKKDYQGLEVIGDWSDYGYPVQLKPWLEIEKIVSTEADNFFKLLEKGIKKVEKTPSDKINTAYAFDLMQSEGLPFEITQELAKEKGVELRKAEFDKEFQKHQELSRKSSKSKFKIK